LDSFTITFMVTYVYTRDFISVEIRTQNHWDLICRRSTTPPRVLFPKNILLPSFLIALSCSQRKMLPFFKNIISHFYVIIFTLLKLRKSEIA